MLRLEGLSFQHTVQYVELTPQRFQDFWDD
jgi:hypothetical protein